MRVLASIFDFLNSHRFTLGISSYLIFGFFALSSLISFGQNSLQTGLVAWYPFDGNASDMSGNGNHGTVNGATLSTDRHGQTNKAYQFDGVDDFIDLNNPSILGTTNNFTILAWVNNGTGTIYGEFNAAAGNSRNYFKVSGNYLGLDQYFPSGGAVSSLEILELNQTNSWNLVGYVRAGSSWSFFVHGQLLNSGSNVENYSGSTPNLGYIGARAYTYGGYSAGAKDFFTGSIDNVRIYNRALSAEEVSALYRLESPNHFAELNSTVDLEMIHVEPGTFTMGSPLTEAGRGTDETEHNVSLTKEFYLGKYEVTQAQYEAVMTGNSNGLNPNPSNWPNNPNRPVEKVSWDDIEIFLTRLNDAEYQAGRLPPGWAYTLPTEAQWEYACRAGTSSTYFWGYSINSTNTNYNQNIGQTQDVGEYAPNLWGFYDMHGNVFEWTADLYGSYDLNLVVDPVGPSNGAIRVFRGGSLNNSNYFSRSAKRQYQSQSYRSETKGFRLAYVKTNQSPGDLNSTASLTVLENQPVGSVVGEFNATDLDANATLTYHLISGAGDGNNSLFTLDQNGTLKTAVTFDYETNASFYSIRVQARDEFNATVDGNFTINLLNNSWEDIAPSQRFSPNLLNGLQLWLDANHSSALTSSWSDLSGNNNHATRNADPVVVTNAQNGLSLMDYSGTNGQHHSFNRISDIRTVFWVLKYNAGYWVLLGDTTSYDFHSNGASGIFHSSFAHNGIRTGSSFAINGSAHNIDGAWPQSLSIISLRTSANVQASNFSNDRNIGGRFPNARLGELIVFNEALPDYEMDLVEGYLAHKWGLFSSLDYIHPFYGSVPTVNDYNSSHSSSSSFQADSIPNLSFWLDANDSSTFTLADSNVTQWRDKSGNGHVMDQIVGPGAPTRLVANGTGFVSFDGTTSIYTNTHLEDANYTIFTVSKQTGVTNARLIASKQSNWALGYFNGKYDSFYLNGWVRQGLNASNTQGHIHVVSANDADQVNCWVDFLHLVSDSNLAHDSAYKPGYLNLGGYGAVERSNGEVAEILYFNRVLDTEERVKIEGYLAHKWLLSSLLPVNHYYKNNPPVFGLLEENATVTGSVQYQGVIPGPAYVWALDENGMKVAEYVLPDGNGSYFLSVPKGRGYDFKTFVDGSQNGYPTTGEIWKHYLDWNSSLGGYNLLQVDGNLTGINFSLWDQDSDNDGFLKWHEHVAGTQDNNASSTPPLNFGLLAHWSFDETNGTVLHDLSGNDINGTLHGFSNPWSPGRVGGAFRFDGVDDYISFNGASQLDDIRPISFSGWIKLDQNGSGYVIAKRSLGTGYWRIFASDQSKGWLIRKSTVNVPSVTTTSPTSYFQWQHIAMTWNGLLGGENSKIYLDGTLVGNVTRNSGSGDLVSDVGNLFTIGNRPQNNSSYFKGWMDDFRIWERVVTPNEVQQLYNGVPDENATVSGVVTDSTTVPGSVIIWVFDENGNKVAEQSLPNGSGAYSFSLVRGHSYDVKAFCDGNGNGSLDPGLGESYVHWGSWNGNGFDLLPVDGNKTGVDITLAWEPDVDNDGFSLWQETQAGTSDSNASSKPGLDFGLVAWWKLDDGNGVVALDSSVNEYNGTLINGPTWVQGKVGGALQFDGLNDHVLLPNAVLENRNNQGTISLWFNAPSANSTGYLFNAVGTSQPDNRYYIRFNAGLNGTLGNPAYDFPANTIQPNTWHFSTMVWRNSTSDASFYLDGQLSSHSDSNYQLHSHIGKANLGSHMGVNGWFAGLIDEVRIYSRALGANEITALHALDNTPQDQNASVSGTVQYNGMIPGPAYVWALDANGTKVAEQILADGNGSYSLNVPKGAGYDFKVFIDGTGDGNPQAYEVWKHIGDWNSSLGGFNLTQVDGNLSGINFNLFDSDYDSDGFTNWQEYQAGTNQNDANSTPGLNFGLVAWYPFDGNASDMSGNGNHGTVNGATLGTDRHGQTGMAYDFDGVNDKIIVNGTWPSGNSSRSVSVWYKAPSHKGNIFTFGDGLLQKARFSVGLNFNNIHGSLGFIGQGSDQIFSVNGLYDSWNMILLTYDGLLGNLYLNGGILSESFNYILETNGSMPLIIGSNSLNRNDEFFLGSIDQVHIYDRALSAFEVQTLYQMEKPKEVLTDANFHNAVNLWFSDEVNATATYGHISDWNTSAVTDMSETFKDRANFNEDIGGWDVSSVTKMENMFNRANDFNQDIGNWDTSRVQKMGGMFFKAKSFNQSIGIWVTSSVENMGTMFAGASAFNKKINDWNVSSVEGMGYMFSGATSMNQDFSQWNISSVNSMTNMFENTPALSNENKGLIHASFSLNLNWSYNWGVYANANPIDLNTTAPLTIVEGQLIGSLVGTFSVVDPDVNASIHFDLVDGNGSDSNHEFSLDTNGTLRTAVVFDYEGENSDNDPTLNIRVRARDEFNASVEQSFMVLIMDVNVSHPNLPVDQNGTIEHNSSIPDNGLPPTVDQNESLENNSTLPITNEPIDGNVGLIDRNNTAGDSNGTFPIVQVYRPIPETLDFVADADNTYLIRGRVLTDGGSPILESGVLVSEDILFRGEMIRLSSNNFDESPEFSVMVRNLTPGTTYYYRAYARNEMGETLGVRKRLKTPEEIDPNMWFANMQNIGGGWRSSDWFGQFQQFPNVDWIYHAQLNWAYVVSDQKGGIWIWQNGRGWMWTQKSVWPYLYRHQTTGWLYLLKSLNGNPIFYDYMIGNYSIAP